MPQGSIQSRQHFSACLQCLPPLALGLSLVACGGGGAGAGASQTLSGIALTGAAIKQAPIRVMDSTDAACPAAQTDDNGAWSVSLRECGAGPWLIQVSATGHGGQIVQYFSAATKDDVNNGSTVLVSQLTDAQVKLALRTESPVSSAGLTPETLKNASTQLLQDLVPDEMIQETHLDTSKDLRTTTVSAGSGQGLDRLHDRMPEISVTQSGTDLLITARATGFGTNQDSTVVGATLALNAPPGQRLSPPSGKELAGIAVVSKTEATQDKIAALTPEERIKGEIGMLLSAMDREVSHAIPKEFSSARPYLDSCFLQDGLDKDTLQKEWNNNLVKSLSSTAYAIGAKHTNLKVLNVSPSPDNSWATANIQYDIQYSDGTIAKSVTGNLLTGSSAAKCKEHRVTTSSGQSGHQWRFIGNGKQARAEVLAVNGLSYGYSLADASPRGNVTVSSLIALGALNIRDPQVTYVIVKGPQLPQSGIKMLSPVLLRDAPELQGKPGNYKNQDGNGAANMCSAAQPAAGSTKPVQDADKVNCMANGALGNGWTLSDSEIDQLPDQAVYTFEFYVDDGWKTVNGQSGQTPRYTYRATLNKKPFKTTEPVESHLPHINNTDFAKKFLDLVNAGGGNLLLRIVAMAAPLGEDQYSMPRVTQTMNGTPIGVAIHGWPNNSYSNGIYLPNFQNWLDVNFPVFGKPAAIDHMDQTGITLLSSDRNGRLLSTHYSFD